METYSEFRRKICECSKSRIVEIRSQHKRDNSRDIALNWTNIIILSSPIWINAVRLDTVFPFDQKNLHSMSNPKGLNPVSGPITVNKYKVAEAHPFKQPTKSFTSSSFFVYTTIAGCSQSLYEYTGKVSDGPAPLASLAVLVRVLVTLSR